MSAEASQRLVAEFDELIKSIVATTPKDEIDETYFRLSFCGSEKDLVKMSEEEINANFGEIPEEEIDRIRAEFEANISHGGLFVPKNKSITDGWNRTYEGAFFGPGREGTVTQMVPLSVPMQIVGNCPACGAPVYGHRVSTEDYPPVRHSCTCRLTTSSFITKEK